MSDQRQEYYVHYNGSAMFVKEADFFVQQGGKTDEWGKAWRGPIKADNVEHARVIGYEIFMDGPGEEDGPWAAGWAARSGQTAKRVGRFLFVEKAPEWMSQLTIFTVRALFGYIGPLWIIVACAIHEGWTKFEAVELWLLIIIAWRCRAPKDKRL